MAMSKRAHLFFIIGLSVFATVLIIAVATLLTMQRIEKQYEFSIYPGVRVAGIELEGVEYVDALEMVLEKVVAFEQSGVPVQFEEDALIVMPIDVPLEASGNDYEVYSIDVEATVDEAYAYGRGGNDWWIIWKQRYDLWRNGVDVSFTHHFDTNYVQSMVRAHFEQHEQLPQDANISLDSEGQLEIIDEQAGMVFDYDLIVNQVEQAVTELDATPIELVLANTEAEFTREDVEKNQEVIEQSLALGDVAFVYRENEEEEGTRWFVQNSVYGKWFSFEDGELVIDPEKMAEDIEYMRDEIDVLPQDARWQVNTDEEGKVVDITEMTPVQIGKAVQMEETAAYFTDLITRERDLLEDTERSADRVVLIQVAEALPVVHADTVNELGLTDLLGTGYSNMTGSPYNRRANIDRGIELLNGLLIAPDETFSLVQTLKPFTLDNGYVAELVIKGNETIPEIGGGLCQVGSTIFRGAMNTGLDIIERRNHSYAVSYYSDHRNGLPGTDATIYDSSPDFKFLNDTGNYILLQTRREGNDLYFDFWGQSDGRIAEYTPPTISGWIAPPPTKEIETTELPPGQRRCTESAHAGTTASFDYLIEYGDGTTHTETFSSTYRPWQAVCLVGKEEEPIVEETPAETVADTKEEAEEKTEEKTEKKKKKD